MMLVISSSGLGKFAMPHQQIAEPLRRFPVVRTSNSEEFTHSLVATYGASRAEVLEPETFEAFGNLLALKRMTLGYSGTTSSVLLEYPGQEHIRLQFAVRGSSTTSIGNKAVEVNENQGCVVSSGHAVTMRCKGEQSRATLTINASALERQFVSLVGYLPKGKLEFEPVIDFRHPNAAHLRALIQFLTEQFDTDSVELPPLVLDALEQTIAVSVLCANRHTFSHLLEKDAPDTSPAVVRRAEQYIEANWEKPIHLEDLVAVTNVSARSMFRAFKVARGYSPMAFAKLIRLRHAKDMLADPRMSVTGVAFKCGFGNPGHFAKDYRNAFGELPSETIARAHRRYD
jgi:AraC-like DNA-binding protein